MGIRCLVLEAWNDLRVSGYSYTAWTNAWKALDVLGVGDSLRWNHPRILSIEASSSTLGVPTSRIVFKDVYAKHGAHESRSVRRKDLLEALAGELPAGTIRFGAKVVSIDECKYFKSVHLVDGSVVKAKILVGCDGVNSVVAKFLSHRSPSSLGRLAIRGYTEYPSGYSFDPEFLQFSGGGFRSGFIPCGQNNIMHWFFTFYPSSHYEESGMENDPKKMKQYVLENIGKVPEKVMRVVEETGVDTINIAHLRFRSLLDVLWPGGISKGNVCVAGDALHSMAPDIGQGGCAALEDSVVLARCIGQAVRHSEWGDMEDEYCRIESCLKKYADERRWRSFSLIVAAYLMCRFQASTSRVVGFVRDRIASRFLSKILVDMADFDCGKLAVS